MHLMDLEIMMYYVLMNFYQTMAKVHLIPVLKWIVKYKIQMVLMLVKMMGDLLVLLLVLLLWLWMLLVVM